MTQPTNTFSPLKPFVTTAAVTGSFYLIGESPAVSTCLGAVAGLDLIFFLRQRKLPVQPLSALRQQSL